MHGPDMELLTRWDLALGGLGFLVACVAAASLPAVNLLPSLFSAEWFMRLRPARAFVGPAGAALSGVAVAIAPSVLTWTLFALSLPPALASVVVWPQRIFIALDRLHHASASETSLADEAQVLAYDDDHDVALVAWPLESMVIPHHIVNDVVGKRPVLVSWCHACRSGLLFDPVVDGRKLHFEVAGVYRRNLVMRDRETGSIWQQAEGEAIAGPLRGKRLTLLGSQQVSWGAWRTAHGDAQLALLPEPEPRGLLPKARLMKVLTITNVFNAAGRQLIDDRLPKRETVIGVEVDGASCAFPLAALSAQGCIVRKFGTRNVELTVEPGGFVRVRDAATKEALPYEKHWWFGWREFHPFTDVWTPAPARVELPSRTVG